MNDCITTVVEAFTYDFEGHMTQRDESLTDSADNHEYDGNGRRMRSKLNSATNWTNFIHDELTENLICEYTLISGTFAIKALNTYGLGLISTNREGTIRYFHFDGLGSAAALTDIAQNLTDSYTYDAFGNPLFAAGSSVNPYRYVGKWGYYNDGAMGSSSGMLLLGVRYYWPEYGRFSTWDPEESLNLYGYVGNDAASRSDPSGLRAIEERGRRPACVVRECNEYATRVGSSFLFTHRYICAVGPQGRCAGGLYPVDGEAFDDGEIGNQNSPCENTNASGFPIKCTTISKNCADADQACGCIEAFRANPPSYNLFTSTCLNFPRKVIDCIEGAKDRLLVARPVMYIGRRKGS